MPVVKAYARRRLDHMGLTMLTLKIMQAVAAVEAQQHPEPRNKSALLSVATQRSAEKAPESDSSGNEDDLHAHQVLHQLTS